MTPPAHARYEDLPSLPTTVYSKDRQKIDLTGNVWYIRASFDGGNLFTINWNNLQERGEIVRYSARAIAIAKLYIAYRLERTKGQTAFNDFSLLVHLINWLDQHAVTIFPELGHKPFSWSDLNEVLVRSFLTWGVTHTRDKGNDFSRLRTLYSWGVAQAFSDFDVRQLRIMQSVRAQGNLKGQHVRSRDPQEGPLTPEEMHLIVTAIKTGAGTDHDRALVMLHVELGLNPQATVRLKNSDLKRFGTNHDVFYQLDVPRVKKRTAGRETKRRPLSARLGMLLEKLMQGSPELLLCYWLSKEHPEVGIRAALRRFITEANLISPRTGCLLKLTPRRLRYTLATDMAEDGASKFHIAEVLDHTDLQNVDVYVETVSTIADHIAAATDAVLGPVVNRFRGIVIESTAEPVVDGQLNQVIPAAASHLSIPLINTAGVGVCGRHIRRDGLCRLFPPLSCYLCPSFAAVRSGSHQHLLDDLDAFVQSNQDVADQRILRQLDDVRSAIREVIDRLTTSETPV